MKKLALLLPFLVAGCVAVPVNRNFPDVPKELQVACPDLKKIQDNAKLSEVVSTVAANYGQYNECKVKVDAWNEWYVKQKEIFESVK